MHLFASSRATLINLCKVLYVSRYLPRALMWTPSTTCLPVQVVISACGSGPWITLIPCAYSHNLAIMINFPSMSNRSHGAAHLNGRSRWPSHVVMTCIFLHAAQPRPVSSTATPHGPLMDDITKLHVSHDTLQSRVFSSCTKRPPIRAP